MQITFQNAYLSIARFDPLELPTFTLITGPNGSGKSHFLQALFQGHLRSNLAPSQNAQYQREIRLFDWSSLVPQDTGITSSEALRNERQSLSQNFGSWRSQPHVLQPLRAAIEQQGLRDFTSNPLRALSLSSEDLRPLVGDRAEAVRDALQQGARQGEQKLFSMTDPNSQAALKGAAHNLGKASVLQMDDSDILRPEAANWGQTDIFQQSFGRLFVAYRDLYLANELRAYKYSKGKAEGIPPLSESDFVLRHGIPPWDFVNASLRNANLDFRIDAPDLDDYVPYTPRLTKLTNGVKVPFGALSSGEKILMSFAFCVYYSGDKRQITSRPKILLFDEVDAPLHPSMARNFIETIQKTLVEELGISVISTTHSPSTVALAPEAALYVMQAGVLSKIAKGSALNILTEGVPTISITFDGRRQVFVESPSDAKVYDALYKLVKSKLGSERSLEFVATGTRSLEGSERNTGCTVVKRLVSELVSAGNLSVMGLIDWDGRNTADERVVVLGEAARNGLENIIFDPLIMAMFIIREFKNQAVRLNLIGDSESYPLALAELEARAQGLTDKIAISLFSDVAPKRRCGYHGGFDLQVDARFLETDDHDLEELLVTSFPFLKEASKQQAGKLITRVIETVLSDSPALLPVEVESAFKSLLEKDTYGSRT